MQMLKIALIFVVIYFVPATEERCKDDNVCVQMKTHGLWSADCYNGNFHKFPRCLRSDVEVIDLSYNRLRKITREDLYLYSKLQILYLSDNLITNLENSTLEAMYNIVTLDISLNGITKLPPVIFHLPSLKRLYLSQNQNINIVEAVEEARPITSPLEALDIGFNELETLPNLGVMPFLWFYNISGNNLIKMGFKDIAGLCSLQKLINDNVTTFFDNPCDCWNLQRWLTERKVKFTKIQCDIRESECSYEIPQEYMSLYNDCRGLYSNHVLKSTMWKIGAGVGAAVLVLLMILLYFVYRRRKHRRRPLKQKEFKNGELNGKKDNEELL